ncbi:MAG: glycosyltransferase [Methyloprofundus sp.]|nr:glycosyltransferase [Methyloprofundus sp.]
MNILFVHDHFFKLYGGDCYSSGGLPSSVWARYLSAFDSLSVVGRNGGMLSDKDKGYTISSLDSVSFHLLPDISNLKSLVFGNAEANKACRDLVAQHDAIIARLPSRLGSLFVKEAIKQKKPYAIEVVGCPWDAMWNYGNWKGKAFAPFAFLNLKRLISTAPYALYVTEHFLQGRYPCRSGKTTFCSNVEIPAVKDDVLSNRITKIESSGKPITFGLIGNYSSKYKGIDIAIRALALANNDLPDWEFQVLGSGDSTLYKQLAYELGIDDKVKFVGSLPSGQPVYDWLDSVDIYFQPSFQEGLPRALIEAMSRGCPSLATSIAGIPELLQSAELVKAGDYQALASKVVALAGDQGRLQSLAEQNFNKAKNYYKPVLDKRRTEFWRSFRDYAEGCS